MFGLYSEIMESGSNIQIKRTGNPFVDQGLCCIAALAELEHVNQLTIDDLKKVFYRNDIDISSVNKSLKSFTMVFGTNGPLYQNAFKPNNEKIYTEFMQELLNGIPAEGTLVCECCGKTYGCDINDAWKVVVEEFSLKDKGRKYIGRDFFPLIGSLGNDAQALPCASKIHDICPACLFAVNYIPLSTMLIKGKLVCFESTSEDLMLDLAAKCVKENLVRNAAGEKEILGKKDGPSKIMGKFLEIFSDLSGDYKISDHDAVYVWCFSNSGTGADCNIIEIPNNALKFLYSLSKKSSELKKEFLAFLSSDKGYLFESILNGSDCKTLYPFKKKTGASKELYELYQTEIVGRTKGSLRFAEKLAAKSTDGKTQKEREKAISSDMFKKRSERDKIRKTIPEMILSGEASYDDYAALFNPEEEYLKQDTVKDYDPIMYYMYHPDT